MSEESSVAQEQAPKEKAQRNPVERLVVWGLIGVMILFVCTEGLARFGYSITLTRLQERIKQDDGDDPKPLTVDEVDSYIVGFPSKTIGEEKITFRWKGLLKNFGAIHLPFDEEKAILTLVTDAPPEVEPVKIPEVEEGAEEEAGSGMATGGDAPEGRGDRPRGDGEGRGRRGDQERGDRPQRPDGDGAESENQTETQPTTEEDSEKKTDTPEKEEVKAETKE